MFDTQKKNKQIFRCILMIYQNIYIFYLYKNI